MEDRTQSGAPHHPLKTFATWHADPDMWKSTYSGFLSTLAAAAAIYVVAAFAGYVSREPILGMTAVLALYALLALTVLVSLAATVWREFKPLWAHSSAWQWPPPSPRQKRAQAVYNPIIGHGALLVVSAAFFVLTWLTR